MIFDILTWIIIFEVALCLLAAMIGCAIFFIYLGVIFYHMVVGDGIRK